VFLGTLKRPILNAIVAELSVRDDYQRVVVPCAGNFTVERGVRQAIKGREISSHDVSLYSVSLGNALTGKTIKVELGEAPREIEELFPCSLTPENLFSFIWMLSELSPFADQSNNYECRMYENLLSSAVQFMAAVEKAVAEIRPQLQPLSFEAADLFDVVSQAGERDFIVLHPPSIKGGYPKLYSYINAIVRWDAPRYQEYSPEMICDLVGRLEGKKYLLIVDKRLDDERCKCACCYEDNQGKRWYTYAPADDRTSKAFVMNTINNKPPRYAIITKDDSIEKVELVPIGRDELNHYRFVFMHKVSRYSEDCYGWGLVSNGKIFGLLAVSRTQKGGVFDGLFFLVSDMAFSTTKYLRLAKLVLLCSQSVEFRQAVEERLVRSLSTMQTTVFTEKPVSMKYRGLFELVRREKNPPRLIYRSAVGVITLEEAVRTWLTKYEK